jgi:hypothetical protein
MKPIPHYSKAGGNPMSKIRNLTIIVGPTGKRIPVKEVDSGVTAQELLDSLIDKINLPAGTHGTLERKLTHTRLLPNKSLGSAGVEDGETLIADIEYQAG